MTILPMPARRAWTPEELEADALRYEAMAAKYEKDAADRKRWRANTTPEARARKQAQDHVRKLRTVLREAAAARTWARAAHLLDETPRMIAWGAVEQADKLRASLEQRTRRLYLRAAEGCEVSAAFLADEATDALYREAFAE